MAGTAAGGAAPTIRHPARRASSSRGSRRSRVDVATGTGGRPARRERSRRSSSADCACGTKTRRGAMHVAPPFSRSPKATASATRQRSASGRTKTASLPESSSVAGVSRGARSASTPRPVSAEPVKTTRSTPWAMAARAPATSSWSSCTRSDGSPAFLSRSISTAMGAVQPGAGLSSTALPATKACSS